MIAQGMKLKAIASNWQHHIDILKHCVRRRFVNQRNLLEHLFAFPMDAKFPHVFDADSLKFRFVMEKFFFILFYFLLSLYFRVPSRLMRSWLSKHPDTCNT